MDFRESLKRPVGQPQGGPAKSFTNSGINNTGHGLGGELHHNVHHKKRNINLEELGVKSCWKERFEQLSNLGFKRYVVVRFHVEERWTRAMVFLSVSCGFDSPVYMHVPQIILGDMLRVVQS